jgi:hypothetical protein
MFFLPLGCSSSCARFKVTSDFFFLSLQFSSRLKEKRKWAFLRAVVLGRGLHLPCRPGAARLHAHAVLMASQELRHSQPPRGAVGLGDSAQECLWHEKLVSTALFHVLLRSWNSEVCLLTIALDIVIFEVFTSGKWVKNRFELPHSVCIVNVWKSHSI